MTLQRVHADSWNDDTQLWRYMDVYGFLSLITTGKLKFTNLSEFEDLLEGRMPTLNQATFLSDFVKQRYVTRDGEEVKEREERLERVRNQTWVSSWQQMNGECALMWRVYGSRQNGIALQTAAGKLLDALDSGGECAAGTVLYIDYNHEEVMDEDDDLAFSFHKQKGYAGESEFRVAVSNPASIEERRPVFKSLDFQKSIDKVIVSPWAGEWQMDALKCVVASLGYDADIVGNSRIQAIGQ